jgi:hypothetical protein
MLADKILEKNYDIGELVQNLNQFSSGKRALRKFLQNKGSDRPMSIIINLIDPHLKKYTENTEEHLRTLPVNKRWDRRLATTREQYHLYMLEIELNNRLYAASFSAADKKIALLPHCLRDFTVECKAASDGFDYKCRHCSKICYQNEVSTLLENQGIEAYIWMGADLKKEAKSNFKSKRTLGMLGIACIPELVAGMRQCQKYNLPVIGLPLDANRCVRWMGAFNENSVNLEMLEKLVSS